MLVYTALTLLLHIEVSKCPLILLPFLLPKEDVAIIDVASNANNA